MDEDEEKLKALQEKTKFEEDPSLWDQLKMLWYVRIIYAKKKRTLNALRWIYYQNKISQYLSALYLVYFVRMPTEKDLERARKAKETKEARDD